MSPRGTCQHPAVALMWSSTTLGPAGPCNSHASLTRAHSQVARELSVNTRAVLGIKIEVSDQATVTHQRLGGEVAGRAGAVADQVGQAFPGLHRRLDQRPAFQAPRRVCGAQHHHVGSRLQPEPWRTRLCGQC